MDPVLFPSLTVIRNVHSLAHGAVELWGPPASSVQMELPTLQWGLQADILSPSPVHRARTSKLRSGHMHHHNIGAF